MGEKVDVRLKIPLDGKDVPTVPPRKDRLFPIEIR